MKIATSVVAAIALAACGGSTGMSSTSPNQGPGNQSGNSQLSVSVVAPAGAAQPAIAVSRIRASVASLKLESGADGGEQGEIHEGPFLIDLSAANLGPSLQQVFAATVPAGTFRELDLDIAPSNVLAPQNASIIVDGTFNGTPFTFVTAINIEVKKEGKFTVGSSTATNITIALDPTVWFGTSTAPLDPNVATNRAAIEARIRASLIAFRDDDRNGHDDDEVGDDRGGQQDAGEPGDDHGGQEDAGQGGDDHGQHDGGDDHGHDDGGH